MPKIPILKPPYKNVDEVAVLEGGVDLIDGYFDESGALNKRWGLWSWWSAGERAGVDGLFWWKDKQVLIAVSAGRVFVFSTQTGMPYEITTDAVRLMVGRRVFFATTDKMLFMCNGGPLLQWNGGSTVAVFAPDPVGYIRTEDTPEGKTTKFGGCVVFQRRLIAFETGTQRVYLSYEIEEGDTSIEWKPTFFLAGVSSDNITQMLAGFSELTFFGPYSSETWYFTGQGTGDGGAELETDIPFARIEGASFERGCISPDSAILAFQNFWWLDQERKVIRMSGRTPQIISLPIDRHLRALSRADDCRAFQIDRWICWTFPTDRVTWVFDTVTEAWMKWAYWNQETGSYEDYLGQCSCYVPEWTRFFVGCRKESRILITAPNLVTDIWGPIRTRYRSAHFDHGTMARKRSSRLMLRLKRGA